MNPILDHIKTFPLGGGYLWDRNNPTDGVTRPIRYKDELILSPDAKRSSYCCGISYQVWFEVYGHKADISVSDMKKIQQLWYVAVPGKVKGPASALPLFGLGKEVDYKDAQPGDFCQLWRRNRSGHSVILTKKIETGIEYWSTQPSTNGIGYKEEFHTPVKQKNDITQYYFCRAFDPDSLTQSTEHIEQ